MHVLPLIIHKMAFVVVEIKCKGIKSLCHGCLFLHGVFYKLADLYAYLNSKLKPAQPHQNFEDRRMRIKFV